MVQNMPAMHRDHRCLSAGSAQLLYIKEASSGHTHYGLHLYRLRSSKKDGRSCELSTERESRSSMDRSVSERNLDRSSSCKNNKMDKSESTTSCIKPLERDSSETRALERSCNLASSSSSSSNDNLLSSNDIHTSGTVWLGICGRGIDIYEASAVDYQINNEEQLLIVFCFCLIPN